MIWLQSGSWVAPHRYLYVLYRSRLLPVGSNGMEGGDGEIIQGEAHERGKSDLGRRGPGTGKQTELNHILG